MPDPGARLGHNHRLLLALRHWQAKGAMELSYFSDHRSFQCTLLPLLMNNPEPALPRRSAGRNFRVIGARLTCMILPPVGKEGNWRRFSKHRPIQESARPGRLSLNLSEHGRLRAIELTRAKIRQRTSGGVLWPRICRIWANPSHTYGRPLLCGNRGQFGRSCTMTMSITRSVGADPPITPPCTCAFLMQVARDETVTKGQCSPQHRRRDNE